LSQRIYLSSSGWGDGQQPIEAIRWQLAEKFGWTLDYIDNLPLSELHEYLNVRDGLFRANTSIIKR
jgi:hypothetical protein